MIKLKPLFKEHFTPLILGYSMKLNSKRKASCEMLVSEMMNFMIKS